MWKKCRFTVKTFERTKTKERSFIHKNILSMIRWIFFSSFLFFTNTFRTTDRTVCFHMQISICSIPHICMCIIVHVHQICFWKNHQDKRWCWMKYGKRVGQEEKKGIWAAYKKEGKSWQKNTGSERDWPPHNLEYDVH